MLIKCNNPACDKKIDTNKSHTIRYDRISGCKLYFCSDMCNISHKFIFNKNERPYFHKIADCWKKVIEKDFRKFYDFMPDSFFNFLEPIKVVKERPLMEELEEKKWLYRPLHQFGTPAIGFNDVVKACKKRGFK